MPINKLGATAYQSGVLSVAAAGNEQQDGANVSLASAPDAITVVGIGVNRAEYGVQRLQLWQVC